MSCRACNAARVTRATFAARCGSLRRRSSDGASGVFSTLLDDLERRGLLETTLVVCMGEFGRTPRINEIGSRDHWHHCYFSLWAGASVQGGRVIGESDPRGEHPASEPITPAMVGTTMLELSGISSATRAELRVLEGGRVIHELF